MKVVIAGGSGFVGKALTEELLKLNYQVVILTRDISDKNDSPNLSYIQWLNKNDTPEINLEKTDVFINLAGEPLNTGRWTEDKKNKIMKSRLQTTKELQRIISNLKTKPLVFLNASAIGLYGTSETEIFTENNQVAPTDFLSKTVSFWESEALFMEKLGIRTVLMRFGIILDKNDGALPKMLLPYKLFVGGTIGNGRQWLSWIHIKDVVAAAIFCMNDETIKGAVNFTSPNPEKNATFSKTISQIINRPHWIQVPSIVLKIVLGEMSILVLKGQNVLPQKLLKHGYTFSYSSLKNALQNILR